MARVSDLIPPRRLEDIVAQRVRLVLGGEVYDLLALTIADTEAWLGQMDGYVVRLLAGIDGDDLPERVIAALSTQGEDLMTLLLAYDKRGVLPPKARLRKLMTPFELLCSVLEVWRAANPLVDIGIDTLPKAEPPASPPPTSSRRRNTAGRPASSVTS